MKTTSTSSSPAAYLAVGRDQNRLKIYGGSKVYLQDGQEFLIELFNPTQNTIGAKIFINGKAISGRMVVLRPGERDVLRRYIDKDRKFVFNTYKVGDTPEARHAISRNGFVRVEFYRECRPYTMITWGVGGTSLNITNTGSGMGPLYRSTTGDARSLFSQDLSANIGDVQCNNVTHDSLSSLNEVETGRIEAGNASGQSFDTYHGTFEYYSFANSEYQILPMSMQPVEASKIRQYCPGCRNRIRKSSWKYCPSCGELL
jgi:hypothetical protein